MESKDKTTAPAGRKRFTPRPPPQRTTKPAVPRAKTEVVDDADAAQARELMKRFEESALTGRHKIERKVAPKQVAIGHGGPSSSSRSFRVPILHSSTSSDGGRKDKEYKEPWDYYSYYPVTHPLRRPYDGDPEILNEKEFGDGSETKIYDENARKPALELGLMEENVEPQLLFLQLPATLPIPKRSAVTPKDGDSSSKPPGGDASRFDKKASNLNEMPSGFMGKMVVYKSGKIKLKLGDTLYDVSPGSDCVFAQDVVAMNTEEKQCCVLGEVNKRVIVTPDIDSILDSLMAD